MKNNFVINLKRRQQSGAKILCAYLTLGYPSLNATQKAIVEFEKAGVDVIELGFPFSDPLADGPTIQAASDAAIRNGIRMTDAFHLVKTLRQNQVTVPILFFSYLNPVLRFGIKKFSDCLQASGFDGALVPDLPFEEGKALKRELRKRGLALVYLAAPTTDTKRMKQIAEQSEGFVYYVALKGVTGARKSVPADLKMNIRRLKQVTRKPVLAGFGISRPDDARKISRIADGVIVGSAVVERLGQGKTGIASAVELLKSLRHAMD